MSDEDVEVVVINKQDMDDLTNTLQELMQQVSVMRDKLEEIEEKLGEGNPSDVTDDEDTDENDIDVGEDEDIDEDEEKGIADEGEGGSAKEKVSMKTDEQEPKPTADSGEAKAVTDAIKSLKKEIAELKKSLDVVRTPYPEKVEEVRKGDEIVNEVRNVLEGKMKAKEIIKKYRGGV